MEIRLGCGELIVRGPQDPAVREEWLRVGAVTATGLAASVVLAIQVSVPARSVAATGYAPAIGGAVTIAPGVGAVTVTGQAPTVTVEGAITVAIPAGTIQATGYAPSTGGVAIALPAGTVQATGAAPTVQGVVITLPAGAVAATGRLLWALGPTPVVLGDLTTLWTDRYQPALHTAQAVGAEPDDLTLVLADQPTARIYDPDDLNTAYARYIDTEF